MLIPDHVEETMAQQNTSEQPIKLRAAAGNIA